MSMSQMLLPEIDHETAKTRKFLERLPEDKFGWQPHPKSMTLGRLATHIAEMYGWGADTMVTPEFDIAPVGGEAYKSPNFTERAEVLAMFEENAKRFRNAVEGASDAAWGETWALKAGGQTLFAMPRAAVIRDMILNHVIHHRAQLGLYFRLNDVAVPAAYGPSADEQ